MKSNITQLKLSNCRITHVLRKGASGNMICRGVFQKKHQVVIKIAVSYSKRNKNAVRNLEKEIKIYKSLPESMYRVKFWTSGTLTAQQIRRYFSTGQNPTGKYMVLDFVGQENLRDLINRKGLYQNEALLYVVESLRSIEWFHKTEHTHGDIKPSNLIPINEDKKFGVLIFDYGQSETIKGIFHSNNYLQRSCNALLQTYNSLQRSCNALFQTYNSVHKKNAMLYFKLWDNQLQKQIRQAKQCGDQFILKRTIRMNLLMMSCHCFGCCFI